MIFWLYNIPLEIINSVIFSFKKHLIFSKIVWCVLNYGPYSTIIKLKVVLLIKFLYHVKREIFWYMTLKIYFKSFRYVLCIYIYIYIYIYTVIKCVGLHKVWEVIWWRKEQCKWKKTANPFVTHAIGLTRIYLT